MFFDRGLTSRGHTLPKFMGKSRFSESATKLDVYLVQLDIRVRRRLFDQVGHQSTNASIGNKYFFTK